jgi:hypothetical protein
VKDLFHGSTMTFSIGGHSVEVASDKTILSAASTSGYVILDSGTTLLARGPMLGYGMTLRAPYVWPLSSKPATRADTDYSTAIPPSMLPRTQP